jgi:stage III sporulation protein AF
MMAYIGEWIKHIVLLILMATFLDLILPNSSMRKYVKLVVGFLLILLILSPVLEIFKFDHDRLLLNVDQLLEEKNRPLTLQMDQEKNRISIGQDQAIIDEVKAKWSQEIKNGIEKQFAVNVLHVTLNLQHEGEQIDLQELILQIEQAPQKESKVEQGLDPEVKEPAPVREIELIEPVIVHINDSKRKRDDQDVITDEQKKLEKELVSYLEGEWNISVDKIYFAWTRR